jgi:hypothetical protein
MTSLDARDGGSDLQRLAAEIANEPQWVVFDDPTEEDRWAREELDELTVVAAWWVCVHV